MITAPEGFRRAIEDMRNRDYQMLIICTLASGTVLTIDNSRVWSSGFSYDDALCTTPDALEVGTAIINKVTLVINNQDEHYSAYDFGDAVLEIQIGLRPDDESPISYITKGIYTVDSASYNTMLITLTALDHMYKFDRLYTTIPSMPSTALAMVQDACTVCGVTLGVQTFDGASTAVTVPPTEDITYRQMISWIGQMIGCDWRINTSGELMPVWFNIESLGRFYDGGTFNYNDGANLNGGTFAYNDGDSVDGGAFNDSGYFVINSLATANVAVDDTVITGVVVRVMNDVTEEEAPDNAFTEYTTGQEGFRVVVENNPEITEDNVQAVLTTLGGRLIGMKYRKGQLMHLSDPRLEAGDVFVYADHKDHAYPMICSQAVFTLGEYQTTTSASAVPIRKAAERYGVQTQTTVQIYKSVLREKTSRETAEADLQDQIDNASGLYQTVQSDGQGGSIYLLHDRPTVAESNIIWKMSSSAFGVSTNGGQSYNAGLTADGTAIVQRLYSNVITAGILQSPDYAYSSGNFSSAGMLVDLANNVIRTPSFAVVGGNAYINTSLTLGGANNQNGTLTVLDASGNTIGTWNKDGFVAKSGSTNASFAVDDSSIRLVDREGTEFFKIADLRNENGYARLTYRLELDSELGLEPHQDLLTPSTEMKDVISVYYNNTLWVEGTDYEIDYNNNSIVNLYALHLYPNDVFEVTYLADDARLKAYTLGTRAKYTDCGYYSVSMGVGNTIDGEYATAVGRNNTIGNASDSFVAGLENVADYTSWMMGWGLKSGTSYQTIVGLWNKPLDDTLKYALIVGGGLGDSNRFNAMTVDRDGILKTGSLITNIASKSAYNDGVAGVYVGSGGVIHLTRSATSGGYIGFHYGLGATTTSYIDEPASGILRISGGLRINGHSENIGYYKTDSVSSASLTAGTSTIIITLSLNAGRWLLTGRLTFNAPSTATSTYVQGYIGTVNADGNVDERVPSVNSTTVATAINLCKIVAPTASTEYYLCARAGVARTVNGAFTAIRIQ